MGTGLFWLCLLGIIGAGMLPHFSAKALKEYLMPSDIQIAREMDKFRRINAATTSEIQMNRFSTPQL